MSIKVMSFNLLCGGLHISPVHDWPDRAPRVIETIKKYSPDILGVQEAHIGWMRTLREALGDWADIGVGRNDGKEDGEFSAVFYKKDRFTLKDKGDFWLSETPDVPSKGWDSACIRICSWGVFADSVDGGDIAAMNTHLDHVGPVAQLEGARLIAGKAQELISKGLPVIVTGDFNVTPDSAPAKVITSVVPDARDTVDGADKGKTFHGYRPEPVSVIDYVCRSGLKTKSVEVVRDVVDGMYPSDHFPVLACLER